MAVILFGGTKGGTGKSTLTLNIAVMRALAGYSVLVIDTDKQRSAYDWAQARASNEVTPKIKAESHFIDFKEREIGKKGKALLTTIAESASTWDDVIVDGGGEDNPALRFCMLACDRMFIPYAPSSMDMWALANVEETYQQVAGQGRAPDMTPICLPSRVSPISDERRAIASIQEDYPDFDHARARIHDRTAYRKPIGFGLTALEVTRPDPKAKSELVALYREVFDDDFRKA